jgi:hypothetical protein
MQTFFIGGFARTVQGVSQVGTAQLVPMTVTAAGDMQQFRVLFSGVSLTASGMIQFQSPVTLSFGSLQEFVQAQFVPAPLSVVYATCPDSSVFGQLPLGGRWEFPLSVAPVVSVSRARLGQVLEVVSSAWQVHDEEQVSQVFQAALSLSSVPQVKVHEGSVLVPREGFESVFAFDREVCARARQWVSDACRDRSAAVVPAGAGDVLGIFSGTAFVSPSVSSPVWPSGSYAGSSLKVFEVITVFSPEL